MGSIHEKKIEVENLVTLPLSVYGTVSFVDSLCPFKR